MKTKADIVNNWLPRYTGMSLDMFEKYIILVNFSHYVDVFSEKFGVDVYGRGLSMQCATAEHITIINFGMGSANAATIMDLLMAIKPKACLFLGKCGGLKQKKNNVGDLILPIAAIRGEGTSNDYFPSEVPALPSFALQKAISTTIRDYAKDYWTGTVYTTNRRVWEFDLKFKKYLNKKYAPVLLTWRQPLCLVLAFTMEYLQAHCYWSLTCRWCLKESRQPTATLQSPVRMLQRILKSGLIL